MYRAFLMAFVDSGPQHDQALFRCVQPVFPRCESVRAKVLSTHGEHVNRDLLHHLQRRKGYAASQESEILRGVRADR